MLVTIRDKLKFSSVISKPSSRCLKSNCVKDRKMDHLNENLGETNTEEDASEPELSACDQNEASSESTSQNNSGNKALLKLKPFLTQFCFLT